MPPWFFPISLLPCRRPHLLQNKNPGCGRGFYMQEQRSGRVRFQERMDARKLLLAEAEIEGRSKAFDLLRAAAAHNGCGNGWMVEGPGDGNHARTDIVSVADLAEEFHKLHVPAEPRFLELHIPPAPVVGRQGGGPFRRHLPG